jgi:hypothetical protein
MTAGFQVSVLVFGLLVIVMFLFARFWQHEYENALKDRNKWRDRYYKAEAEGTDEHYALVQMRYKYFSLQKECEELKYQLYQHQQKSHTTSNQDLLDAVKKGMVAAHPDHGGKQEDFIRFHKVYNELRGRAN